MTQAARKHLEPVPEDDKQTDSGKEPAEKPDIQVEAAKGEVIDGGPKTVHWRELELIVPPEIPPVLMFDFVGLETDNSAMSLMRMFHTLLDTEQFTEVRNVIARLKSDEQVEAITELSNVIMEGYGTTEGESQAPADS